MHPLPLKGIKMTLELLEYLHKPMKLFARVGCADKDLECLQSKTSSEVMTLLDIVHFPVPDNGFISNPFLPGVPQDLMEAGQFDNSLDVIIGSNVDEGLLYMIDTIKNPSLWEQYRDNFELAGPHYFFGLDYKDITQEDVEKAYKVVEFYVGGVEGLVQENLQEVTDLYTDAGFLYGNIRTMKHFISHGMNNVYHYILTFEGHYSFTQLYGVEPMGVSHADDLFYLFDPIFPTLEPVYDKTETLLRKQMVAARTNFARYGDPTPPNSGQSWNPVEGIDGLTNFWNISGLHPAMDSDQYINERMSFWSALLP